MGIRQGTLGWLTTAMACCFAAAALPADAQANSGNAAFSSICAKSALQGLAQAGQVSSATYFPASDGRAAYCSVRGTITTSPGSVVTYRVDLPEAVAWNDRLLLIGGGGFDGYISLDGNGVDLWSTFIGYQGPKLGDHVLVATDSGHQGRGAYPAFDMSWAARNPDAMTNHAYRANHLVLWTAVALAKRVYGREPRRRYMAGGSNGGRQGIMAAQRYPKDYDGVVALMPAISQTSVFANWAPVFQHIYRHPDNWLGKEALTLFTKAEIAACDDVDGLRDGVISNYKACLFDGRALACPAERPAEAKPCLTPGQIETIRLTRAYKRVDAGFADGLKGYPGYGPGAGTSAWMTFLMGTEFAKRDGFLYLLANQQVKVLTDDPNADIMTFDPTKWRDAIMNLSKIMDTSNPDLAAFFKRGGKMILWHGVGDTAVSYQRTAEYTDMIRKSVGEATARKSLRSFVSPTLDHYFDGPEANALPFLASIEDWVEKGKAPDAVVATRLDPPPSPVNTSMSGKVSFTRPLCEYGHYPKYRGKGDASKAASFTCAPD
jgi:feruloyl esterase